VKKPLSETEKRQPSSGSCEAMGGNIQVQSKYVIGDDGMI
jgi:hypothetical protein